MPGAWLPGAAHVWNAHPLVVHFPVAFLTGAALLYPPAWLMQREGLRWTAFGLLVLGAATGLLAGATGLYAEPGVMAARSVRAELLVPHKWWMLSTLGLALPLAGWAIVRRPLPTPGAPLFVGLLLVLLATLVTGADYGGRMVFDYNIGGRACGQPIDFTQ